MLLDRLDLRALRVLVVQYSWNDNEENQTYINNRGHLPNLSQADYKRSCDEYLRGLAYYPGKYLFTMIRLASGPRVAHAEEEAVNASHTFLDVVLHRMKLQDIGVVVVPAGRNRRRFARAVRESLGTDTYHALSSLVSVVDGPDLRPEDEFPLDGHPTATGHAAYARAIYAELEKRGLL
jgi:hypothetical protein